MTDAESLNSLAKEFGTWGTIAIFTIYLVYQTIKDSRRNKKEISNNLEAAEFKKQLSNQMVDNFKTNQELLKYLRIATQKYMDEISETQVRILIDSVFDASQNRIIIYLLKIMNENHITGNEREISAKIKSFISNKYHQDVLFLKEFHYNGIPVSEHMNEEWREYIIETTTEIVLKGKEEKVLHSTIQNAFERFKIEIFDSIF